MSFSNGRNAAVSRSKLALTLSVAAFTCLAMTAGTAKAVDYTGGMQNPSFELPGTTVYNAGAFGYGAAVPGWWFQVDAPYTGTSGSNAAGVNTRDAVNYPLSNGSLPGGTGSYLGFINNDTVNEVAQALTNVDTPNGYQPNMVYTMTVALGNLAGSGSAYTDPGNYRLQFLTQQQNTLLASSADIVGTSIPNGSMVDYTFRFTTPANFVVDPTNDAVRIQIQTVATFADAQASFDNVRFDISPVPEPMSAGVLSFAGAALLRRRRA